MLTTWIPPRFHGFLRARRRRAAGHRAPAFRPRLEALEHRVVPATATWDGGGTSNAWSDKVNWAGDVLPAAGDDLVFPAGALRPTNFNNLPSTSFNSLTFSGSGYTISGGSFNLLTLGAGGIVDSDTTPLGTNSYNGPIQLGATRTINVADRAILHLGGVLSGGGGVTKTGAGSLVFDGAEANTYTGTTTVNNGVLGLNKGSDTGTAVAVPSSTFIIFSGTSNTTVNLQRSDQIADTTTVTITAINGTATLLIGNRTDTVGGLDMTGGVVDSAPRQFHELGTLTVNGIITARPSIGDTPTPATISARLALGDATRTFTVDAATGSPNISGLDVLTVSGAGLVKEGAGIMHLLAGSTLDQVDVNAGTLIADQLICPAVTVRNTATLGGHGAITGAVSTDGLVRTLDNGGPGFTAPGWLTVTGQGFGSDVSVAAPSVSTGSVVTASWAFTGLTPGAYRVFATWTAGPDRTTRAPYSVFDNTVLRTTAVVNQERAPVRGSRSGSFVFQQLGGPVNITSGTLRVSLSNVVPAEFEGALVIADAVRIERLAGTLSPGGIEGQDITAAQIISDVALGPGSTYRVDFVSSSPESNSADKIDCTTFNTSDALLTLSSSLFSPPAPGTAFHIINNAGTGNSGTFYNVPNTNDTIELVDGTGQRHTFSINYAAGDGNDVDLVYQNTATQVRDLELSPGVINEGERVTLRGALTDPNRGDVLSLRIDWGDGSSVQTFTDLGTNPFHFTHTYTDNSPAGAPYLVRVEWFDQHGAGNFRKLFVTVNNVPPRLFLGGAEAVRAGEVMRHAGHFTDPGTDTFTATVDYGDGSGPQPLLILPGRQLSFEHRYTKPGKYRVTVTLLDDDGGLATDSFLVIVL